MVAFGVKGHLNFDCLLPPQAYTPPINDECFVFLPVASCLGRCGSAQLLLAKLCDMPTNGYFIGLNTDLVLCEPAYLSTCGDL